MTADRYLESGPSDAPKPLRLLALPCESLVHDRGGVCQVSMASNGLAYTYVALPGLAPSQSGTLLPPDQGRVRIPLRVLYVHVYGQSPTAAKPTRGLRQVPCVYEHILFGCTVHDLCACMTACGFKPADVEKAVRRVLDSVRARVQARLADVPASLLSGLGSHRVAAVQWKKLRTQKHESRLCKVLALGACVTLLIVFRLVADHRPLRGDGEALGALRDFLGRCVHHEVEIDPAELRALERGKAAVEGADENAGAGPSDEKARLEYRLERFEHAAFNLDDVVQKVQKEQQLMHLRSGASEV